MFFQSSKIYTWFIHAANFNKVRIRENQYEKSGKKMYFIIL